MCMKYVNANILYFSDVIMEDNKPIAYNYPFDRLDVDTKVHGDCPKIGDFVIMVQISILGTDDKDVNDNILNNREKLEVTVKMTKCSSNPENQVSKELDSFVINTKEKDKLISHSCYDFLNYTRVIRVNRNDISIDYGLGKYVVKVLVTDPKTGKRSIQTMKKLSIEPLK